MNSDEDKLYTKILALATIYNFVAEKFLIWNFLKSQYCFKFMDFEI
jgi:hypothetical protein